MYFYLPISCMCTTHDSSFVFESRKIDIRISLLASSCIESKTSFLQFSCRQRMNINTVSCLKAGKCVQDSPGLWNNYLHSESVEGLQAIAMASIKGWITWLLLKLVRFIRLFTYNTCKSMKCSHLHSTSMYTIRCSLHFLNFSEASKCCRGERSGKIETKGSGPKPGQKVPVSHDWRKSEGELGKFRRLGVY